MAAHRRPPGQLIALSQPAGPYSADDPGLDPIRVVADARRARRTRSPGSATLAPVDVDVDRLSGRREPTSAGRRTAPRPSTRTRKTTLPCGPARSSRPDEGLEPPVAGDNLVGEEGPALRAEAVVVGLPRQPERMPVHVRSRRNGRVGPDVRDILLRPRLAFRQVRRSRPTGVDARQVAERQPDRAPRTASSRRPGPVPAGRPSRPTSTRRPGSARGSPAGRGIVDQRGVEAQRDDPRHGPARSGRRPPGTRLSSRPAPGTRPSAGRRWPARSPRSPRRGADPREQGVDRVGLGRRASGPAPAGSPGGWEVAQRSTSGPPGWSPSPSR